MFNAGPSDGTVLRSMNPGRAKCISALCPRKKRDAVVAQSILPWDGK
jgi:hypothetical protein